MFVFSWLRTEISRFYRSKGQAHNKSHTATDFGDDEVDKLQAEIEN